VQEWCAHFGELLGVEPTVNVEVVPGASVGSVGDIEKRLAITGPCRIGWREGLRALAAQKYPDRVR
jgi:hypothetical protein